MAIAIMETNLIVDFPSEQRARNKRRRRPSVQFSSEIEVRVCKPLHLEADAKDELFYSSRDYREFNRANKRDVQRVHRRYLTGGENVDAFDGCELAGIENLLTPELIKRTSARRVGCINAVLNEQDEQDAAGCYDPEGLARASRRQSTWAAERSRKIGIMHELM